MKVFEEPRLRLQLWFCVCLAAMVFRTLLMWLYLSLPADSSLRQTLETDVRRAGLRAEIAQMQKTHERRVKSARWFTDRARLTLPRSEGLFAGRYRAARSQLLAAFDEMLNAIKEDKRSADERRKLALITLGEPGQPRTIARLDARPHQLRLVADILLLVALLMVALLITDWSRLEKELASRSGEQPAQESPPPE